MPEAQTSLARKIERLRRQANEMRRRNLRMIHEAGMGHIGKIDCLETALASICLFSF